MALEASSRIQIIRIVQVGVKFMRKHSLGLLLLLLTVPSAPAQEPNAVATRFGALSVSEDGVLLFQSVPVRPLIEANNSLDLSRPYQIGASDVVLVTDNGGTACPALYYFVTVTKSGVRVTPSFGTCSDLIKIKRSGDSISVSMPGYRGSAESKQVQRRAAREMHVFNYHAGAVTENGRPVKFQDP